MVLATRVPLRWRLPSAIAGLLGCFVILVWASATLGVGQNYFLPTGHLFALGAGAVAAVMAIDWPAAAAGRLVQRLAYPAWAFLIFLVVVPTGPMSSYPVQVASLSLMSLMSLTVVLLNAAADQPSGPSRMLTSAPAVWLGRRSYGIYLYSSAIHLAFTREVTHLSRAGNVIGSLVVSLVLADLSFRFLEAPLLAKGRRWYAAR